MQYHGRGKEVTQLKDTKQLIVKFTDEATAFHDVKRAIIPGKGAVINAISIHLYEFLEKKGIPTHFIQKINSCEHLCKTSSAIPLNVVVRNVASGSMAKRLGVKEGQPLLQPVYEIFYKDSELSHPLINKDHALALGISSEEDLTTIREMALNINEILIQYFKSIDIKLLDFKIEFGKDENGNIILTEEISPDKSRMCDIITGEHLDKDHFSRDLGDVLQAYEKILTRLITKESA